MSFNSFESQLDAVRGMIEEEWTEDVIPKLVQFIKVPNLSPFFDQDVLTNGHMEEALGIIKAWVEKQPVRGMKLEVVTSPGRTPLLFIEVAAEGAALEDVGTDEVLLYGHMDKQPPFDGWKEGLGPYTPVIRDGKLYGRGGADDGYACFAAILAIRSLQKHNIAHPRCVIVIEASEESGSKDLPHYMDLLAPRIGSPNLVVCLDAGCGNYEQLWVTTSLRGCIAGHLNVKVLTEGVHSGAASGIVPDSFRIARNLLSRLEDPKTGEIVPDFLKVEIPEKSKKLALNAAKVLGEHLHKDFPFRDGVKHVHVDGMGELALNKWWRAQLSVIGASGIPDSEKAGNVLRPETTLTLSLRLPPTVDASIANEKLTTLLTENPPYNADVSFTIGKSGTGWAAPPLASWLEECTEAASKQFYGKSAMYQSEGGSIPFMGMLGKKFPQAQFLIVGVLGPNSNAHGPNEFLHIDFSCKLTGCVASVLSAHCANQVERLNRGEPSAKRAKSN